MIDDQDNVGLISSNVNSSRQEAMLYVFEDNEAVIKMIITGRSPTMRHVSRIHRVALVWLFDRIHLDPKIQISTSTPKKIADILTEGNFTRDEWNHILCWFNIAISVLQFALMQWRNDLNKIQVKTSDIKISTNDESYCKGAVARIVLDFSKAR